MSLATGARLDHYEIIERIGVGGMGEVFRARDTRLPREVAIKVSSQAFNERFAREAKVIASLNHPNICTLFDVGPNYLVMELVEGATLQDHIKQGPMSLEEASRIGRQIADALDYAHEHGVIHRDLKPANVKVRPDSVVKVLDFGLAKAIQAATADEVATVSLDATQAGAILGTPNYMSPEQATGRSTDKRSDTWAFGIVFYEMLAGGKPFGGSTIQETIAATLRDAPDLSKVPPQARRLLRKCLEKDPQNRLKHLGDVMSLLDDPISVELAPGSTTAPAAKRGWLWPSLTALALVGLTALAAFHFGEKALPRESFQFQFGWPPGVPAARNGAFSISPDGMKVVFAATENQQTHWWLRRLDSKEAQRLDLQPNNFPTSPVWSPDSRSLLYTANSNVVKADIAGGSPQVLCENCSAFGASWGGKGSILLGASANIMRIPESGGTPTPVITAYRAARQVVAHPVFLPDGKHFLYLQVINGGGKDGLFLGDVDLKPEQQSKQLLLETNYSAAFVPGSDNGPGHILFLRDGTLFAQPFDADSLKLAGAPVAVAQGVGWNDNYVQAFFSASNNGRLIWRGGSSGDRQQLTWFDREGKNLGTVGDPGSFVVTVLSPDGRHAAMSMLGAASSQANTQTDIWVEDLGAGTRTRLTFEPTVETLPVWTDNGAAVIYASLRDERWGFYKRAANGAPGEQEIYRFPKNFGVNLTDCSPDGKRLVFQQAGDKGQADIWTLATAPGSMPEPLVQTPYQEVGAHFSRDGRWISYRSAESGRSEIYVTAAPGSSAPAGKWLVSNGGGTGMTRWRRDGREFYYLAPDGGVMAVDIVSTPSFQAGKPHKLFDVPDAFRVFFSSGTPGILADVTPDGQRFLFAVPLQDAGSEMFNVITDWRVSSAK